MKLITSLCLAAALLSTAPLMAQTEIEAKQQKLVTRYYQLLQGMDYSCSKPDLPKQVDYRQLLQRFKQTQPDLLQALQKSPHYAKVLETQQSRLQAAAAKSSAADRADACDYYALLMSSLLDDEAGKQALRDDINTINGKP